MAISIINRCLSLAEFREYVAIYNFGGQPANKLVIHHTWRPTKAGWAGARSIEGLKRYYENKGWSAGPHLFIAEEGIWLFSPMRLDGIHAGELNHRSIGIEVVGDYDNEIWSGNTKENALGAIKILMKQLGVDHRNLFFHRDVSPKTCPGKAITKEWLFNELGVIRIPTVSAPEKSEEIMIPVWAAEAVAWVRQNKLFEITSQGDVRDAVKFYRFYKLIKEA